MKKLTALLLFLQLSLLNGQNLDSLFNRFVSIKGNVSQTQTIIGMENDHPDKCGLRAIAEIKNNFSRFSQSQQNTIIQLLDRPATDTSFATKYFRIHFNKSNFPDYVPESVRASLTPQQLVQKKKLYLDSLGIAADYAYNLEVNTLGYPKPQSDLGQGGDNLYDIYISNIGPPDYGATYYDPGSNGYFITYTKIDDDYVGSGYNTNRIDAARVTIAHELLHAIHLGNYTFRNSDIYYYEISCTAMEEFVFDYVNDYYADLRNYLASPEKSFRNTLGYDKAIFNIFLEKKFGHQILKDILSATDKLTAIEAIESNLQKQGTSFKAINNEFGLWAYFTGPRAISGKFFEEANKYGFDPAKNTYTMIKPLMTSAFTRPTSKLTVSSYPCSNNYLEFTDGSNSLISIITNADIESIVNVKNTTTAFDYYLTENAQSGYKRIVNNYYSKIVSLNQNIFLETNAFNDKPIDLVPSALTIQDYVYPQPYKYSIHSSLVIPTKSQTENSCSLNIYTIDMRLVYSNSQMPIDPNSMSVLWNPADLNGNKLPTGVYIYITKIADEISKGKFVIYND